MMMARIVDDPSKDRGDRVLWSLQSLEKDPAAFNHIASNIPLSVFSGR